MLLRVADRQNLPYFCSEELHVGESLPAIPLSTLRVSFMPVSFMPGTGKLDSAIPTPTAHRMDSFLCSVEPPSVALDAGNSGQQLLSQAATMVPHATRHIVAGSTRGQEGCLGNIGKAAKQHSHCSLVMRQREQLVLQSGRRVASTRACCANALASRPVSVCGAEPGTPPATERGRPAASVRKVPS